MKLGPMRVIGGLVCALPAAVAGPGCGHSGPSEPADSREQVGTVDDALQAPSGNVDASSTAAVDAALTDIQGLQGLFAGLALAAASGQDCASGTTSGSIDLSCATHGEITGTAEFTTDDSVSGSEVSSIVSLDFEDLCQGGRCATGSMAIASRVAGASPQVTETVAYTVDVTEDGETSHHFFGMQVDAGSTSVLEKVAILTDDGSFVVDTSVDASGASFSIRGANGTWTCSVSGDGGSCDGNGSFSF